MPVITIANTKGGAGKTTAAALLTLELSKRGYAVTVFDSDPQKWISQWLETAGHHPLINVVSHVTPASLECHIRDMRPNDYFIIDLAGEKNQITATALAYSHHVLIPVQGSGMDAKGAAKILDLIAQIRQQTGLVIPHSVLLSRVNPMVTTRSMLAIKGLLAQRGVEVMATPIIERAAYRDMFDLGRSLYELDPEKCSNLDKAMSNARDFSDEVLKLLPSRIISSSRAPRHNGWNRAA
ncbi:ParA family protein [Rhizobium alvei]|uniref:ParA family protein n=1 Tax=Rhizobium alvei TaxID=1132659 RepID=A0ABT8YH66_9HYPH|nr:ParA family protein [Rhizobium alvei]MDO6963017.1 ParA family protein [Rhizobium alvei]